MKNSYYWLICITIVILVCLKCNYNQKEKEKQRVEQLNQQVRDAANNDNKKFDNDLKTNKNGNIFPELNNVK